MRVVFDTNIFISAFAIPGSKAEQAYLKALDGFFELFSSVAILTETAEILDRKFKWSKERIVSVLGNISSIAEVKKVQPSIHVLADEADNRILECAQAVKADFIVTGDKKLLSLKDYEHTRIVSLSNFLESLNRGNA